MFYQIKKKSLPYQLFYYPERLAKEALFNCHMCGQCILRSTSLICPMQCPKQLRNGPCGGVRDGGFCEVKPEMKCVWVLAWDGASRMKDGAEKIREVMPPVEHSLQGSSSWLRVSREKAEAIRESREASRKTLAKAFPEARANEPAAAPLSVEPSKATQRETAHPYPTLKATQIPIPHMPPQRGSFRRPTLSFLLGGGTMGRRQAIRRLSAFPQGRPVVHSRRDRCTLSCRPWAAPVMSIPTWAWGS